MSMVRSGDKYVWPALSQFFIMFDFDWPSSHPVMGREAPPPNVAQLGLCLSVSSSISVVPTDFKHFFNWMQVSQ